MMVNKLLASIVILLAGILGCMVTVVFLEKKHLDIVREETIKINNQEEVVAITSKKQYNIAFTNQNLSCLSEAIFHEAGIDAIDGKEAVGLVIFNRAEQKGTQNLCSIVHESQTVSGKRICQFSYYCLDANKRPNPISGTNWAESMLVSVKLLNNDIDGKILNKVGTATHFHATYVHPTWTRNMKFLGQVGSHLFYFDGGTNEA